MAKAKSLTSTVSQEDAKGSDTDISLSDAHRIDVEQKDDTKYRKRIQRAQRATVDYLEVGVLDTWGLLSKVKPEFMKAVGRMCGHPGKKELMLEFLELAKEIVQTKFESQTDAYRRRSGNGETESQDD